MTDEEYNEQLEKISFLKNADSVVGTLGKMLAIGAGLGAATYTVNAGVDAIQSWNESKQVNPLYNEMLLLHPKLNNYNPERTKLYYNQLWHFSPHVAKNPLAAGNYVYYAMQFDEDSGGPGLAAFKALSDIQKDYSQPHQQKIDLAAMLSTGKSVYDVDAGMKKVIADATHQLKKDNLEDEQRLWQKQKYQI